ncbi:MAG: Crp/Fnr family transcriptional regulator [Bacteroidetes bacterium]|jgi:CRP-like cAMP-binding protein|nr:Crp/Fnr family transcriptional regulator [Bacteroidota bacterium]
MQISTNLLLEYGGIQKIFEKNEYIFHEGDTARYFYQIVKGRVKVFCTNDDGKLFVQGVFADGNSFGEPPLLIKEKYPVSAIALCKSVIIKIGDTAFEELMNKNQHIQKTMIQLLARRIFDKSKIAKDMMNQKTEHRILSFLEDFKAKNGHHIEKIFIPFTRQEIADFTGLRVETVIRSLLKLKNKNIVEITNRKLYY